MGCGASSQRYVAEKKDDNKSEQVSQETKAPGRVPETESKTPEPEKATGRTSARESTTPETEQRVASVCQSNTVFENALIFASKIPLFRNIPQADLPLVVKVMSTSTFKTGEDVVRQGDVMDKLYIILSGKAEVVRRQDGSSQEELHVTLHSGDYFGEREVLHAEAARATVRAAGQEDLLTYSIAHDAFWKLELNERLCMPKRQKLQRNRKVAEDIPLRIDTTGKSDEQHQWLVKLLQSNTYLNSLYALSDELASQLAAVAVKCIASAGEILFTQGKLSVGHLCIVESGAFDLKADGNQEEAQEAFAELAGSWGAAFGVHRERGGSGDWDDRIGAGDSFGELELLYSLPSAATVMALEDSVFWSISRKDFLRLFGKQVDARITKITKVLSTVRIFNKLYQEERIDIAKAVNEVTYSYDEVVASQGEVDETCYILVEGEAQVLIDGAESGRRLSATGEQAEIFGEENLLNPGPSPATLQIVSETAKVLEFERTTLELVLQMPLDTVLVEERIGMSPALSRPKLRLSSNKVKFGSKTRPEEIPPQREELEIVGHLGSGNYGFVDLAVSKQTERRYALKRVKEKHKDDKSINKQLRKERDIMLMTNSPFLVKLLNAFKEGRSWSFLMELVEGGDLRSILYRDDVCGNVECARFYCVGTIFAIEHLHERHIVHRDLKPDNIMLDEAGWPKVADFGLSKFCVGKTYTACGTPVYMAPETFQASGHGLAVDWWSLGILIYELMAGNTPFESATGNFKELLKKITKGIEIAWSWPPHFDMVFIKLLSCLLQAEESRRLPMRQNGIKQLKRMSWFKDINWESYKSRNLQPPVIPPKMKGIRPCLEREAGQLQLQASEKSESSEEDSDRDVDRTRFSLTCEQQSTLR